jgi:elongation factor G
MKKYDAAQIRNIGLVGHGSVGKTSLTEAMLFNAKAIDRLGKVDDGTTTTDYDDDERKRHISISTAVATCEWDKHKLNIIDMPGFADFVADAKVGLPAADVAVVLVCGVSGVEVMTNKTWEFAEEGQVPRILFVNKLERERASLERAMASITEAFGDGAISVQLPIGQEANFTGVVDLLTQQAYVYSDGSGKFETTAVPADMADAVAEAREALVEKAAEGKDDLIEKYLEEGELSDEEVFEGLRAGILAGTIFPVFCGSAVKNIGVAQFLDSIVKLAPSPLERPAVKGQYAEGGEEVEYPADPNGPVIVQVFKTFVDAFAGRVNVFRVYSGTLTADTPFHNLNTEKKERIGQIVFLTGKKQTTTDAVSVGDIAAVVKLADTGTGDTLSSDPKAAPLPKVMVPNPIISFAIKPKSRGDEDKIGSAFTRLMLEDLTLKYHRDERTGEFLLSGMGQLHVEVMVDKLKNQFGVDVVLSTPKVPYLETIKGKTKIQGRHKKQTGGHGQFGDCWIEIEPLPGGGFEFVDNIVGGVIPKTYIPAVEKGIQEAMARGILAGYPVTDLKVSLYDGSYHPVDSSEMAFKIAGSLAFKNGAVQCKPTLLEPIMKMEIIVPEECMGDVMGDINSRRGRVLGMDSQRGLQVIKALVPMAEVLKYAPNLTSMTGGRGTYGMEFDHYEEVPAQFQEKIIDEAKRAAQDEE